MPMRERKKGSYGSGVIRETTLLAVCLTGCLPFQYAVHDVEVSFRTFKCVVVYSDGRRARLIPGAARYVAAYDGGDVLFE